MMKDIVETLKTKLEKDIKHSVKDKDIAPYLNMTPAALAVNKTRNSIPYEAIVGLCKKRGWDLNEILIGADHIITTYNEDTCTIKLLENVYGSCGGGSDNEDLEEQIIKIDRSIIDSMHPIGSSINVEAIKATGDSMEPTIKDGATVLLDRNNTNIAKSGIFVIRTQNGLLIKRISQNIHGGIDIMSDNPLYLKEKATLEDITVVGKVLGSINAV